MIYIYNGLIVLRNKIIGKNADDDKLKDLYIHNADLGEINCGNR
jgi:hypothetical protein